MLGDSPLSLLVLAHGTATAATTTVLTFDGTYGLRDATRTLLGNATVTDAVAMADCDGDADLDLVVDWRHAPGRVLRGSQRSFTAPFAALLGSEFELRLRDETLSASGPALAVFLVGSVQVRVPIAGAGVPRVDPATAISLPPAVIPVGGNLSLRMRIPAALSLRGSAVVAQAWTVYAASRSQLSALVRETLK